MKRIIRFEAPLPYKTDVTTSTKSTKSANIFVKDVFSDEKLDLIF